MPRQPQRRTPAQQPAPRPRQTRPQPLTETVTVKPDGTRVTARTFPAPPAGQPVITVQSLPEPEPRSRVGKRFDARSTPRPARQRRDRRVPATVVVRLVLLALFVLFTLVLVGVL